MVLPQRNHYFQCFETSINIQGLIPLFRQLFLIDEQRHELWDLHFNARKPQNVRGIIQPLIDVDMKSSILITSNPGRIIIKVPEKPMTTASQRLIPIGSFKIK